MAALYLGVSQTAFREKVKARRYPQPVREGGRLLWARRQLEAFVDAQFNLAQPSSDNDSGDKTWDDL
ncbi:AlpA family transcriptional regulator [Sphingosinicella sp. BN140058]|uniref:helix-turn-helix transcriptional regulator n=1 Tax=Sphingosinicella sp. BN140058 TaxID=1892855 RepID=UPI0010111F9D|nr:DNA-binding protein [Sphingosinicella sp. BN140058]QAY77892.1 DNA-binding protein [Sphingosinicella sp. BN140058]